MEFRKFLTCLIPVLTVLRKRVLSCIIIIGNGARINYASPKEIKILVTELALMKGQREKNSSKLIGSY